MMMSFKEPFVCCGICHRSAGTEVESVINTDAIFWLTSCAHILCSEHVGGKMLKSTDLERIKITCPVCRVPDVSVVQINDGLPVDLKPYLKPFPRQIESLFAAAQFQYCGLVELIGYQKDQLTKLNEKIEKQRKLLYAAKVEVSQVEHLKIKLTNLEKENESLAKKLRSMQEPRLPFGGKTGPKEPLGRVNTIDLTNIDDDSGETAMVRKRLSSSMSSLRGGLEEEGIQNHHQTFVRKMQKSSISKKIPMMTNGIHCDLTDSGNSSPAFGARTQLEFSKPIMAESTNAALPLDEISHGKTTPSGSVRSSSVTPSANRSSSMSFSNGGTGRSIRLGTASTNNVTVRRPFGHRSSTTQSIVERLSAHMKVSNNQSRAGSRSRGSLYRENLDPRSPYFRRG